MFDTSDFNNVFDTMEDDETVFDNIFGAEEDNELIDTVIGFNEAGESLPDSDELHLDEDDTEPSGLDDYLGPNNDTSNTPTTKPSGIETEEDEMDLISGDDASEAGDFYNYEDDNYQKGLDEGCCKNKDDSVKESDNDIDDDLIDEVGDMDDDFDDMDDIGDEDVEDIDESYLYESDDEDMEDELIDTVEKDDTTSGSLNKELKYDTDDEELIDMVSGED